MFDKSEVRTSNILHTCCSLEQKIFPELSHFNKHIVVGRELADMSFRGKQAAATDQVV